MELCALRSKIYFIRVQLLGSFGFFLSAFSSVNTAIQDANQARQAPNLGLFLCRFRHRFIGGDLD